MKKYCNNYVLHTFQICLLTIIVLCASFVFNSCQNRPYIPSINQGVAVQTLIEKKELAPVQKEITTGGLDSKKEDVRGAMVSRASFSDEYVVQITSFYQNMITLLLGLVGVILVIGFVYVRSTSLLQAKDMAAEALESDSFKIVIEDKIKKEFVSFKNSDEISGISTKVADLEARVDFLDKAVNLRADEEVTEGKS